MALVVVGLVVAGCGSGLSEENVEERAEARAQEIAAQMVEEQKMESDDAMMMAEGGDRLRLVRERGKVICASRNDVPGYGYLDASGNNAGFDIDLCRALAAAVLGDPKRS